MANSCHDEQTGQFCETHNGVHNKDGTVRAEHWMEKNKRLLKEEKEASWWDKKEKPKRKL